MSRQAGLITVAVAVICRGEQVLIAKRPSHVHCGDLWEFPGGKVEASESIFSALQRECQEELGISVLEASALTQIIHHYPEKSVQLEVQRVHAFEGEPEGREGQVVQWVSLSDLAQYEFPSANQEIINALSL